MFAYYLNLAMRSLKRNRMLTLLMILTIAIGVGATMTTLTVYRVLSGNPIPEKSDVLYRVQVDPWAADASSKTGEPPKDLTRLDAEDLMADAKASRQTITNAGDSTVEVDGAKPRIARVPSRHTTSDFFAMFNAPIKYGRGWTKAEDASQARVALLNTSLAKDLFGTENAVGKSLRVGDQMFQIIGIIDKWEPLPRFYDISSSLFSGEDQLYVPFSTARANNLGTAGNMDCTDRLPEGKVPQDRGTRCTWLNYWVELPDAKAKSDYLQYLNQYSVRQKENGWFFKAPNVRLRNVMEWLDYNKVVPADVKLQLWLALGFLLVCMVNVVGLLLAKFMRRSGEIGVRRALGATRGEIFKQFLTEAGIIGAAGGIGGLLLALLGLAAVRKQPVEYASLAHIDGTMLTLTIFLAIAVTLFAGALPAWRAMRITPAIQLKSQ